jgi:hypothetical protein
MDIWNVDKLTLFLMFFVPGFVSLKVYDLLIPSSRRDFSKSVFEVVGYSALNFGALSWLIYLIHHSNFPATHEYWYLFFLFWILVGVPVLWPFLILKAFSLPFVAKHVLHPVSKPWDYVFGRKESYWVIVHLKDGKRIGGRFDTNSFASSDPAKEQLYLEEVWKLNEDDAFIAPVERSGGIIISEDNILAVEILLDEKLKEAQ